VDPDDLPGQVAAWVIRADGGLGIARISRKCAPSMVGAVTSSTTKATCGLERTLRYLALLAIWYPAMSIVPRVAL
jgi:hypothetical protein